MSTFNLIELSAVDSEGLLTMSTCRPVEHVDRANHVDRVDYIDLSTMTTCRLFRNLDMNFEDLFSLGNVSDVVRLGNYFSVNVL